MDIFDGLHPQCADSIDVEKSDSSVAKAHSLTISAGNANRHQVFKKMSYLPANPCDIKLRVLPSYTFVPMSEVEQHVQQMVAARAQAVPEPDPVCNLPPAKRQATITSYFRK